MFFSAFFAFVFASIALATPLRRASAVHESRQSVPYGFISTGPSSSEAIINLRIGLAASNLSALETTLYAVSTPGSHTYGQYLSNEEVKTYATPAEETVSAVTTWLSEYGVQSTVSGPYNDWLDISVPVSKANVLLGTNFENFVYHPTGQTSIRTLSYRLPVDLFEHIDVVHPTVAFFKPIEVKSGSRRRDLTSRAVPSSCASLVNPSCLEALYGIPLTPATQSNNQIGIVSLGQSPEVGFVSSRSHMTWSVQESDLMKFLQEFRPDTSPNVTFTTQLIDGGLTAGVHSEANLDLQYTAGLATGVPVTLINVNPSNTSDGSQGFLDVATFLQSENPPPQVITTSFGFNGKWFVLDVEGDLSTSLETRLCNVYMTLGVRGVSVLFAAGDGGVAGFLGKFPLALLRSYSQPILGGTCATFVPTFPSTCPYVTSVSATTGIAPEVAATLSSGGFSNNFPQPSYQSSAVATYLSVLGSVDSGEFNRSGHGFPDVSAQGINVEFVDGGDTLAYDGTSFSSPIFASVIALINDRLIAAGKPVLGFLNPFLYANPNMFNDIISGSNPGPCNNTSGFPAKAGWDPVTGLGTPNFNAMLKAAGL